MLLTEGLRHTPPQPQTSHPAWAEVSVPAALNFSLNLVYMMKIWATTV